MKEIPRSWLIMALLIGLVGMRFFGIDSWTTATLSVIIGYITGKHIQENKLPILAVKVPVATADEIIKNLKEKK